MFIIREGYGVWVVKKRRRERMEGMEGGGRREGERVGGEMRTDNCCMGGGEIKLVLLNNLIPITAIQLHVQVLLAQVTQLPGQP